jgi:exosome complex RNA-binding protein Rrp42 (RNase PH superfamily)
MDYDGNILDAALAALIAALRNGSIVPRSRNSDLYSYVEFLLTQ